MSYTLRIISKENRLVLRQVKKTVNIQARAKRGLTGPQGPKGDKGDQGDPATNLVTSVNGKQGIVVLDSTDVGADPAGSASQALSDANDYTDGKVSGLDAELATVAKTGSYNDLDDKPTIPTVPVQSVNGRTGNVTGLAEASDVATQLNTKVDKVAGKGLSTEDYTSAEKTKLAGIESGAQVNTVTSVSGKTGAVTLAKSDVGLGNVDNTSDLNKPISTATQTALDGKSPYLSLSQFQIPVRNNSGTGPPNIGWPYSSQSTPATFVLRDGNGTFNISAPTAASHPATKDYVDDKVEKHSRATFMGSHTNSYRELARLPIDDAGNSAVLILNGRIGGWLGVNSGYVQIMMSNRTAAYTGNTISSTGSFFGSWSSLSNTDLVIYRQTNKSAILYAHLKASYEAFDLTVTASGAGDAGGGSNSWTPVTAFTYTGIATTPTGTEIWRLSTSNLFELSPSGDAILKSPNGSRWRLSVDNSGNLGTTAL